MDLAMELTGDHNMSPAAVSAPPSGGVPMVPSFYQGPVHQHHHGGEKAMKQLMTSGLGASGNGLKGGEQHKTSDQVVADQAREILRQAVVSGMGGGEKAVGGVLGKATAAAAGENGRSKAVRYRECQKNHAAGIGGHALDGCGEFIPAAAVADDPDGALRCAACDCHRNFHRREVEGEPCECKRIKASTKTTFSPAAPALPLAMAAALSADSDDGDDNNTQQPPQQQHMVSVKKRFRTKFSNDQKDQMCAFAEKLGWRIQKHDEAAVQEFCATVGVKRHVLKVWMHNNKHTMGKKP